MIIHERGCRLYSLYWLRHAVAVSGRIINPVDGRAVDRVSAMALMETLARYVALEDWETVTLKAIADQATLMNQERFRNECSCGAFDSVATEPPH